MGVPISGLPSATSLNLTDIFAIVQSGTTKKSTIQLLANLIGSGISPSGIIYVAKNGNDTTGNGTYGNPYLTLTKANTMASGAASAPIQIDMAPGDYTEATLEIKPFVFINGGNSSLTVSGAVTTHPSWALTSGFSIFENFTNTTFSGNINLNLTGTGTGIFIFENIKLAAPFNFDLIGDPINGSIFISRNVLGFGLHVSYNIENCYGGLFSGSCQDLTTTNCPSFSSTNLSILGNVLIQTNAASNSSVALRQNTITGTTVIKSTSTGIAQLLNTGNFSTGTITLDGVNTSFDTDVINQIPLLINGAIISNVTHRNIADTLTANYLPTNYTPVNTSVKGHLGGIDAALGTPPSLSALTIGTGLNGGSYNGSAAVTIEIDASVVTLTGIQTLSDKTLVNPIFDNTFSVYDNSSVYKMDFFVNPGSDYANDLTFTIDTNNQSAALSMNGPLSFAGQFTTTGNFPVQLIFTAASNPIFPPGNYTLARADEVNNGNVSRWIVGETLATAPYTSLTAAAAPANAEFLLSGKQQEVFVQPGEYSGDYTPLDGVNITALGNSANYFSLAAGGKSAVVIKGKFIISNALNISISGISIKNPVALESCVTSSGTNPAYINWEGCSIIGNGTAPAFGGSNPNCFYSFNNNYSASLGSFPVFFPSAGNFKFKNCVQVGSGNPSRFTSATAEYYNCIIQDSFELNGTADLKIFNSSQKTLGVFSACIFQSPASTLTVDNSTFDVPPGITPYVFEGGLGGTANINNATFKDLTRIEATLTINSFAQSTNNGNVTILTAPGNFTFTPKNRILILNKTIPQTTIGLLPPPGTSIGATYEMTDGKGNAAITPFYLDAGVGFLINNSQTATAAVNYQSFTVRDIGTKYIII